MPCVVFRRWKPAGPSCRLDAPIQLKLRPPPAVGWEEGPLIGPLPKKSFGLGTSLASHPIIKGPGDLGLAMAPHRDKRLGCEPLSHTTGDKEGLLQCLPDRSHLVRKLSARSEDGSGMPAQIGSPLSTFPPALD